MYGVIRVLFSVVCMSVCCESNWGGGSTSVPSDSREGVRDAAVNVSAQQGVGRQPIVEVRPGLRVPQRLAHFYIYGFDELQREGLSVEEILQYGDIVKRDEVRVVEWDINPYADLLADLNKLFFDPETLEEVEMGRHQRLTAALSLYTGLYNSIKDMDWQKGLDLLNVLREYSRDCGTMLRTCVIDESDAVGTFSFGCLVDRHAVFEALHRKAHADVGGWWKRNVRP